MINAILYGEKDMAQPTLKMDDGLEYCSLETNISHPNPFESMIFRLPTGLVGICFLVFLEDIDHEAHLWSPKFAKPIAQILVHHR